MASRDLLIVSKTNETQIHFLLLLMSGNDEGCQVEIRKKRNAPTSLMHFHFALMIDKRQLISEPVHNELPGV